MEYLNEDCILKLRNFMDYVLFNFPDFFDDEFQNWAFDRNSDGLMWENIPSAWNKLHSDIYPISDDGDTVTDIERMIELWRENKNA